MMTTEVLEKHLKKTTILSQIGSLIIGLTTALTVGYAFYYNTTNTLETHTVEIESVKEDIKNLTTASNSNAVFQGTMKEQMQALKDEVSAVKHSQERMEDKLDKLILQK